MGTRDKVVQVFILDAKGELQSVFCVQMDATVPISVSFADNIAKDVYVFGLHNGYMSEFITSIHRHLYSLS